MAEVAQIKAVLASEVRDDGSATLPIELDAIPGAVWQAELQSLMPADLRVSLFERGGQKCAVVTVPDGDVGRAEAAFAAALEGANVVSQEAHQVAAEARARRQAAGRA